LRKDVERNIWTLEGGRNIRLEKTALSFVEWRRMGWAGSVAVVGE